MDLQAKKSVIREGRTVLGIELGSTRIKGVLLDEKYQIVAIGEHVWENKLEYGVWTYHLEDVWNGLQDCFRNLKNNIRQAYNMELETVGAIGISAMMHGYLVFGNDEEILTPFRTWRNTMTEKAATELVQLFEHQIPQRWSIAHLYQSVLEDMEHVKDIRFMTTLAGYVHWKLTGEKVLGIGDASGMFPIDTNAKTYDADLVEKFEAKVADRNYPWKLKEILPKVLLAGEQAGVLTEKGARLLDPDGVLKAGIPMCSPEGDAGTGMVATNSVKVRTGNVSAGTSVFSMIVLENRLTKVYPEIDIVTTPDGNAVAMVHCNNCTSDLNAWIHMFHEFCELFDVQIDMGELYGKLYNKALEGDKDCGGLLAYNYVSGEHITHLEEGRPLFVRNQDCNFTLANFMRTHLFTALAAIKVGNDILSQEGVEADVILGHGGLFKTEGVGQCILAAALNTKVAVMKTAGEGGAWGIAILAAYMLWKEDNERFCDYLENKIFADVERVIVEPDVEDVKGFEQFTKIYKACLPIERAAVDTMRGES